MSGKDWGKDRWETSQKSSWNQMRKGSITTDLGKNELLCKWQKVTVETVTVGGYRGGAPKELLRKNQRGGLALPKARSGKVGLGF